MHYKADYYNIEGPLLGCPFVFELIELNERFLPLRHLFFHSAKAVQNHHRGRNFCFKLGCVIDKSSCHMPI